MAHIHRTGAVIPKQFPVKLTSSVKTNDIPVGSLVAFESGYIIPVENFTWNTNEATTQLDFAAAFAGIASGASDKDTPLDTRDHYIAVCQDGEVEFDCVSADYLPGDFLTPNKAAGNALVQTVEKTAVKNAAIAIVSEVKAGATRIRGYLCKTLPKRAQGVDLDVS